MKTPISYYGGKQTLAKIILELIPEHRLYCEPFFGGGAIFFAKEPSKVEVINDTNGELINFYEVLKHDFNALKKEIEVSLHSRKQHHHAEVVYANPDMFDKVKRAWAIWVLANSSYGNMLDGTWGYGRTTEKYSNKLSNKRANFSTDYVERLQRVQLECCDALRVIRSRDTANTFFYLDPPYVGADQGHYDGYTQEDFDGLLNALERIQGNFILSSYRNRSLEEFATRNGWYTREMVIQSPMTNGYKSQRKKIEVLTANYPIALPEEPSLFTEAEAAV